MIAYLAVSASIINISPFYDAFSVTNVFVWTTQRNVVEKDSYL